MKRYSDNDLKLTRATLADVTTGPDGWSATGRLLPDHQSDMAEYIENGQIDGVPVEIVYLVDDEIDTDAAAFDYEAHIDVIRVDLYECDRQDITDGQIDALIARLGAS
jgi:hypothetical protein